MLTKQAFIEEKIKNAVIRDNVRYDNVFHFVEDIGNIIETELDGRVYGQVPPEFYTKFVRDRTKNLFQRYDWLIKWFKIQDNNGEYKYYYEVYYTNDLKECYHSRMKKQAKKREDIRHQIDKGFIDD